jgi:hypothetical protein
LAANQAHISACWPDVNSPDFESKKTRTREVRASFLFFLDASARPFTDGNGNGGGNNCGVQAVITHSDLFFSVCH